MHTTRHDLPEKTRKAVCKLLSARLADLIDLQGQLRQAHWSVRGPNFIAYHELLGEQYEGMTGPIDDLAERIGQLGGQVAHTVRAAAEASSLDEYPLDAVDGQAHIKASAKALAQGVANIRASIDEADKLGDALSADLLTGVGRSLDKNLWMIEAHLQGRA